MQNNALDVRSSGHVRKKLAAVLFNTRNNTMSKFKSSVKDSYKSFLDQSILVSKTKRSYVLTFVNGGQSCRTHHDAAPSYSGPRPLQHVVHLLCGGHIIRCDL